MQHLKTGLTLLALATSSACGGGSQDETLKATPPLDINQASLTMLKGIATLDPVSAEAIIYGLSEGVSYKGLDDFAGRVCPQFAVNLEQTSIQIGVDQVIYRGGNPEEPGFLCAVNDGTYTVNNKKHNYVGHVTLLR